MASWTVEAHGSVTATPNQSDQNGISSYAVPIDQSFVLQDIKAGSAYVLTGDAPRTVSIDPCLNATFVVLKVVGGYVRATLSPTSEQPFSVRVDPYLYVRCDSDPITAITIQRPPATEVTVHVFIGQRS